jgi:hypothetical protein
MKSVEVSTLLKIFVFKYLCSWCEIQSVKWKLCSAISICWLRHQYAYTHHSDSQTLTTQLD